ncbi:alpha/beta hydrolase family protein [Catellatospora tritici]|uniref:alpha/beta hydrolase family protein n=1 Tax=Catellatospora tritici TaxID=2851566 RepID=UPI001C2D2089|nr:alpha/beta fold hydrolase [Catellatospora tritici]MBV1852545.1 alpha/beta fold hydrolase [Catellatospora tritici]
MQLSVDRGSDRLAVQLHPVDDPAAPLVVLFPAMGVPGGYYKRFAASLNEAGLAVAVADPRGNGASTPAPSRSSGYGYPETVDDVAAVLDALAEHRAGRRTILLGHSLGGQACVMHLARRGSADIDGLVLIAVGLPYWRNYPRGQRLAVLAMTQTIGAVSALLRVWPGWGFGGRQARGVIRDWAYSSRWGRFPAAVCTQEQLATIDVPALVVSVDNDRYTPRGVVDHLAGLLSGAAVRREHLRSDEAGLTLNHFVWVKAGAPLAARITDWLPARQPS